MDVCCSCNTAVLTSCYASWNGYTHAEWFVRGRGIGRKQAEGHRMYTGDSDSQRACAAHCGEVWDMGNGA